MQEWLNWPAWKARIPHKGIGGSNPPLSASEVKAGYSPGFLFSLPGGSLLTTPEKKIKNFAKQRLLLQCKLPHPGERRAKRGNPPFSFLSGGSLLTTPEKKIKNFAKQRLLRIGEIRSAQSQVPGRS